MRKLGTSGTLGLSHADGTKSCLLQIDSWDFHWQGWRRGDHGSKGGDRGGMGR